MCVIFVLNHPSAAHLCSQPNTQVGKFLLVLGSNVNTRLPDGCRRLGMTAKASECDPAARHTIHAVIIAIRAKRGLVAAFNLVRNLGIVSSYLTD